MTQTNAATHDYNAKLAQDLADIGGKVKRGMLPLVARNPALERATSTYVLAREDHFEEKRAEAVGKGRPPTVVPPAYRDCNALDKAADLVLYEELTWSHPDKMTILEYPTLSDTQLEEREADEVSCADIEYDHKRRTGWRKTVYEGDDGATQVGRSRITETDAPEITDVSRFERLHYALNNADLTDRQRQAIDLIYFADMTQEDAAEIMGVHRRVAVRHLDAGLRKLREIMT